MLVTSVVSGIRGTRGKLRTIVTLMITNTIISRFNSGIICTLKTHASRSMLFCLKLYFIAGNSQFLFGLIGAASGGIILPVLAIIIFKYISKRQYSASISFLPECLTFKVGCHSKEILQLKKRKP